MNVLHGPPQVRACPPTHPTNIQHPNENSKQMFESIACNIADSMKSKLTMMEINILWIKTSQITPTVIFFLALNFALG